MASRLRLTASGENPITYSKSGAGGEGGTERKPEEARRREVTDLGGGSEVVHVARFVAREAAWGWFDYLDKRIPWTRPTIRVFGRSAVQEIGIMIVTAADPDPKKSESAEIESCMIAVLPRDTCYVADEGLTDLRYSGHQPHAHSWDEFPVLKDILNAVHEALPGSHFNSLLLNRYKTGSDYVSWHADDEPLYGPTPEIASVTFGCEREFLLRKKLTKSQASPGSGEVAPKRLKVSAPQQHSFLLKHGSLLVMRGYTQRDWQHSVPKRAKASSPRINLTFRRVL